VRAFIVCPRMVLKGRQLWPADEGSVTGDEIG